MKVRCATKHVGRRQDLLGGCVKVKACCQCLSAATSYLSKVTLLWLQLQTRQSLKLSNYEHILCSFSKSRLVAHGAKLCGRPSMHLQSRQGCSLHDSGSHACLVACWCAIVICASRGKSPPMKHVLEDSKRQACNANVAHKPFFLQLHQLWNCLLHNLQACRT